jgi:hypothetical protein
LCQEHEDGEPWLSGREGPPLLYSLVNGSSDKKTLSSLTTSEAGDVGNSLLECYEAFFSHFLLKDS